MFGVLDVRRCVQKLENPLAGGDRFLKDIVDFGEAVDWLVERDSIGQECDQGAQSQLAIDDHD